MIAAAALAAGAFLVWYRQPSADELAVRAAVYRHMFSQNGSGLRSKACAYYLGVADGWTDAPGERRSGILDMLRRLPALLRGRSDTSFSAGDPDPRILASFRRHRPPVKRVSECVLEDLTTGIQDKRTKDRGLVFITGRITKIGPNVVEVEGGYYENGLSSSGNVYRVVKHRNRWVVVKDKLVWIS